MIVAFIGEIILLRTALNASNEYTAILNDSSSTDDLSSLPYATFEGFLSKQFNRFFFGAISDCNSKNTHLFFTLSLYCNTPRFV